MSEQSAEEIASNKVTPTASTLRIGKRYRAERIDADYDAIVIGSGIGGLCSAALLSKLGKKVIVLEQHYTAGGFTHAYERNGYEWDVGVHYIGDMGRKSQGRALFDCISGGNLKWAEMDPVYDRIIHR
jgi:all-trans-retinol 13,14-reductase